MSLWWLQPGWKDATCGVCGKKIYPEGDPDWGECYECFSCRLEDERRKDEEMMYPCDICGIHPAVTGANGYGVCSEECDRIAMARSSRVKGVVHETRND